MHEKQKSGLIMSDKSKNMPFFFLQNLFLAILMLIHRKLVQRRGIGEKCCFFRYLLAVTKGLIKLLIFFDWAPKNASRAPNFILKPTLVAIKHIFCWRFPKG